MKRTTRVLNLLTLFVLALSIFVPAASQANTWLETGKVTGNVVLLAPELWARKVILNVT